MRIHRSVFSFLFSFLFAFFLVACGGGSSGGAGGGDPAFDITPYVGEWLGRIDAIITISGQSAPSTVENSVIVIGPQGQVIDPDSDPLCPSGTEGQIINSNPFSWSASYDCSGEGFGLCKVDETGTLTLVETTKATGGYTQTVTCPEVNIQFKIDANFAYIKQS